MSVSSTILRLVLTVKLEASSFHLNTEALESAGNSLLELNSG